MRVFLDANVLYSAALAGSRMREFLNVLKQHAEFVTSAYALEEARRNLESNSPERAKALFEFMNIVVLTHTAIEGLAIDLAEKDKPILAAAVAARCTHLLTGDRMHFGHLYGKSIAGTKIANASLLAEELVKSGLLTKEQRK